MTRRPAEGGGPSAAAWWRSPARRREDLAGGADGRLPEPRRPEFPAGADLPPGGLSRRQMLGLMGASAALGGLAACRRPVEEIVPWVQAPPEVTPGIPRHYATALTLGAAALGVVVESHEGRPTKVEGNPAHPSSRGGASAWAQAALLELYDPDRLRRVLRRPAPGGDLEPSSWGDFASSWAAAAERLGGDGGRGLAVLAGAHSSPTLARLAAELAARFPASRWVVHEPAGDDAIYEGLRRATGGRRRPVHDLARARRILALDADLFLTESEAVAHAKGWAAGRRAADGAAVNRLYAVESVPSITGATADHRLRLPSNAVGAFAAAVAEELGLAAGELSAAALPAAARRRARSVAADLAAAPGAALVAAGRRQPPAVHALVHALNRHLGAPVTYRAVGSGAAGAWDGSDLAALARAMAGGEIDTLVVIGANPAYTAPGDLDFAGALARVPHVVTLAHGADETAVAAEWVLPLAHPFEAWGDAEAAAGAWAVTQPLIAPLFGARGAAELVALLARGEEVPAHDLVRETWAAVTGGDEARWRRALHEGVLEGAPEMPADGGPAAAVVVAEPPAVGAAPAGAGAERPAAEGAAGAGGFWGPEAAGPAVPPAPPESEQPAAAAPGFWGEAAAPAAGAPAAAPDFGLELVYLVAAGPHDGRFANNPWLQELPDPVSKIAWGNAAWISPRTAADRGLDEGQVVTLTVGGRKLNVPVAVVPGVADGTLGLALGYGRTAAGRVGDGVGYDAYRLRSSAAPWIDRSVHLAPTPRRVDLTRPQDHWEMEGRDLVRESVVGATDHAAGHGEAAVHPAPRLWQPPVLDGAHQWGMVIDLGACTGCQACVTACQAENNVPVVGAEQVRRGREMQWLRVDRYHAGGEEDPVFAFQPVPCMHCENAPCEQVCPVAATVHDSEGINGMTYNRCIGTRYCSNNCPYKVRRFNFFNYTKDLPPLVALAMNPDVTVRSRGVMEKCTYCIQRINEAKMQARLGGRGLADGDVTTACQQTCPADAIVFGDVAAEESRVSAAKASPRNYVLLAELNNVPRTSYLARLRNPDPAWEEGT